MIKYLPDLCENLDSQRVPITESDRKPGSIPYYGASGIVDYVEKYIFDEDLLLVSEDGANLVMRNSPIAFSVAGKTWVNNHAHVLRFHDHWLRQYVELYLNSISLDTYITGTAQPKLNQKMLNDIPIPVPDETQIRHIVTGLSSIHKLISLRKQQIAKLDELVKSRFIEMFGNITETVPLSYYIAALIAGKSLAGEEVCPNKVLKTGAATYDYFDPTQVKDLPVDYEPQEEHRVNTGDVIISRMNTAELVGAAAYVWEAPECTYLPDRLWRAEIKDNACPIFIWQVLIQSSTKDSIRRIASGTSGSMKNISKSGMLGILVKKVPLDRQQQFAAFVAQTNQQKLTIQHSLAKLETLRMSLMQTYFG